MLNIIIVLLFIAVSIALWIGLSIFYYLIGRVTRLTVCSLSEYFSSNSCFIAIALGLVTFWILKLIFLPALFL